MGRLVTPPAVKGYISQTPLNILLRAEFTACRVESSLHLYSIAGANVVGQEAARDGNLATSRSPDDLFPLFRRGSTVQAAGAGNRS